MKLWERRLEELRRSVRGYRGEQKTAAYAVCSGARDIFLIEYMELGGRVAGATESESPDSRWSAAAAACLIAARADRAVALSSREERN